MISRSPWCARADARNRDTGPQRHGRTAPRPGSFTGSGPARRPDADIRREAEAEVIAETFLADSPSVAVTVHDGIVTLTGRADTGQFARGLVMAVGQIDGVVAVRDQLGYRGKAR